MAGPRRDGCSPAPATAIPRRPSSPNIIPMTGSARSGVDEFGDVRTSTDEINRVTGYTYDKMGRLTELVRPSNTLTESYRYDGLGPAHQALELLLRLGRRRPDRL